MRAPDTPVGGTHPVRYALTGAKSDFARTLLAQTLHIPRLRPTVLCDLDPEGTVALCAELGYRDGELVLAHHASDVRRAADSGRTAVVSDTELLAGAPYDVLVEATGVPAVGHQTARRALLDGRHVAMVSKETDAVAGPALAGLARERGLVYTPALGDQPANLIQWVERNRSLGLEIVAVGKSGEYDLVFDPGAGTVTQLDTTVPAPALADLLDLGDDPSEVLAARARAVASLTRAAAADYCEMAVVANATGLLPDTERLHYPVARPAELADIYASRADGGLLERAGAVDVFSALRLPGEASFAGGVFAVVRTHDPRTWHTLAHKGHVVSRDGRYACLFLPYHLMGVETPLSLLNAVDHGVGVSDQLPAPHALMAARTTRALPAGTSLRASGHHHEIDGLTPVLLPTEEAPGEAAPFYLAAGATTATELPPGHLLTLADLAGADSQLSTAWCESR